FWHNFKYSFKTLLKNKTLLFWTFAFPIILGLLFNMAFSDIEKNETLDIIDIAIIDNEYYQENEIYKSTFKNLSDEENENQLFNITVTSEEEAKSMLSEDKITGILKLTKDGPILTVNQSGINETILRYVVDEISSTIEVTNKIFENKITEELMNGNKNIDYEKLYEGIMTLVMDSEANIKDISNDNLSYTMIEYYTLIAMSCLYGGMIAMFITNYKLANMNSVGKRTSVSPIQKGSMLLGSLLASYIIQLVGLAILFLFTIFVIKVDYGSKILPIILLALVGSLAGLTMGVAVATLVKSNENTKTGILVAITMTGCFLSGMMGITMKYIIDKNIPILNIINPASMITDGLYSLYYYDTPNRYIFNIASLLIFSLLMIAISIRGLRREKYDSI
ncbi:MAG: ABC transporter permease, partial [Bacilli bacterium]|nr:ABC transporter permease [Bacilli bacterium]